MVACRAHDATLFTNNDRAAVVAVGLAHAAVVGGRSTLAEPRHAWTNSCVAARATMWNVFNASTHRLVGHGVADMGLAFASDVSIGA